MVVQDEGSHRIGGGAGDEVPPPRVPASWKPLHSPSVSAFPLDDELVLHDSRSGEVYVLNRTGARIWTLCDGSSTAASVAQAMSATFGLSYEEALADVRELVDDLRHAGLLRND